MARGDASGGQLDFLVLAALARLRGGHAYAVIASLREASDGVFDLPEGSVYPALRRLEHDGLVSSAWDEQSRRPRRVYRLTATGRVALAEHQQRWQVFAKGMAKVVRWAQ